MNPKKVMYCKNLLITTLVYFSFLVLSCDWPEPKDKIHVGSLFSLYPVETSTMDNSNLYGW